MSADIDPRLAEILACFDRLATPAPNVDATARQNELHDFVKEVLGSVWWKYTQPEQLREVLAFALSRVPAGELEDALAEARDKVDNRSHGDLASGARVGDKGAN